VYVNGLYRTGHLTAEAGPAILRIFDPGLLAGIHDNHIARAYERADTATHAGPFIDIANHLAHLLIEDLQGSVRYLKQTTYNCQLLGFGATSRIPASAFKKR
jgi:hypothetical protein